MQAESWNDEQDNDPSIHRDGYATGCYAICLKMPLAGMLSVWRYHIPVHDMDFWLQSHTQEGKPWTTTELCTGQDLPLMYCLISNCTVFYAQHEWLPITLRQQVLLSLIVTL